MRWKLLLPGICFLCSCQSGPVSMKWGPFDFEKCGHQIDYQGSTITVTGVNLQGLIKGATVSVASTSINPKVLAQANSYVQTLDTDQLFVYESTKSTAKGDTQDRIRRLLHMKT